MEEIEKTIDQIKSNLNAINYYKEKHDKKERFHNWTGIKDKFYNFASNYQDFKFTREKLTEEELNNLFEEFNKIYSQTEPPKIKCGAERTLYHHIFEKKYNPMKEEFFNVKSFDEDDWDKNIINNGNSFNEDDWNKNTINNSTINTNNKLSFEDKIRLLYHNNIFITKLELNKLFGKYKDYELIFEFDCDNNSLIPKSAKTVELDLYSFENLDIENFPNFFAFLNSKNYDEFVDNNFKNFKNLFEKLNKVQEFEVYDCNFTSNKIFQHSVLSLIIKCKEIKIKLTYKDNQIQLKESKENKWFDNRSKDNIKLKWESEDDFDSLVNSIKMFVDYKNRVIFNPETLKEKYQKIKMAYHCEFDIVNKINGNFEMTIKLTPELFDNVYLYDTELEENINFPLDLIKIKISKENENSFLEITMKTLVIRKIDIDQIFNLDQEKEYDDLHMIHHDVKLSGPSSGIENVVNSLLELFVVESEETNEEQDNELNEDQDDEIYEDHNE